MKKLTILICSIMLACASFAQDKDYKSPSVWFNKVKAEAAKALIKDAVKDGDNVTYYKCETLGVSYSLSVKSVDIKPSTKGEPYYDLFIKAKDQTGEMRTRNVNLDQVWIGKSNLCDELGVKWEECSVAPNELKKKK